MTSEDDPVIFRLFTEVGIIEQLARNQLERCLPEGMTMSQFGVLNHLVRLGGDWNPLRLARAFQVTKGAMTNTLQRLAARNLITIAPDPADGRGKLVSITDAGREMRTNCLRNVAPLMDQLSGALPDTELAKVLPVLEKVRKYLDTHRP